MEPKGHFEISWPLGMQFHIWSFRIWVGNCPPIPPSSYTPVQYCKIKSLQFEPCTLFIMTNKSVLPTKNWLCNSIYFCSYQIWVGNCPTSPPSSYTPVQCCKIKSLQFEPCTLFMMTNKSVLPTKRVRMYFLIMISQWNQPISWLAFHKTF